MTRNSHFIKLEEQLKNVRRICFLCSTRVSTINCGKLEIRKFVLPTEPTLKNTDTLFSYELLRATKDFLYEMDYSLEEISET